MLKTPTWTLKKALHTVLDNAQDYLADVSFHYGETTLWAHRAILLARIPESFLKKHLSPILGEKSSCAVTVLDIERLVPLSLIQPLLRFWYTSEFLPSHTEPPPSLDSAISTSSSSDDDHIQSIRTQLRQLEDRLKVQLLPCNNTDSTDFDRLVSDLERMRNAQLATDVIISIFSPLNISKHKPSQQKTSATDNGGAGLAAGIPSIVFSHADDHDSSDAAAPPSFPAHRFILASQSPYFYAMFCGDFREASTSTIHLPADLFNTISTQVIINYFYTGKVSVPSYSPKANPSANAQQRLTQKKYSLRVLQQVFAAADYLGHFDTICLAALNEMEACCHQLKCHCSDCAVLLPSMLWFADKNADVVPEMREKLISLYAEDPIHNIAPLWSQKPFAVLVGSLWTPSSSTEALVPLENEEKTLVSEIASLVLENITKCNAIHVLHSLHLCLSQIRSANPMSTWSTPLLDLLNPIIHHTVDMVSQNFDFYCTEYPILLSCIDGIGHGFSVDFLEFLLNRVLSGGIQDDNAGILYQGIVRDLVGRQQVVKNVAVDGVLVEARQKCVQYLSRRWPQVKAQNGFKKIDKETMRHLADDLGVPYRTLAKPFESDFSAIFSFRPKASKKSRGSEDSGGGVRKSHSEASPPRRLSLSALRSQISSNGSRYAEERNSSESDIATTKVTRSRSLSKDFTAHSMISDNLSAENIDKLSAAGLSSQSLIHMLSLESESRRQRLEAEANYNPQPLTTLADALLPLDLSSEVDEHPRPSRLKFALPTAPLRAKSPVQKPFLAPTNTASGNEQGRRRSNRRGRSPRRSRWGIGSSSDLSDDEELVTMVTPVVGSKVELLRRPLPTLGTIKYIGPVNFARGTWVGVELESRLGKNDGAVDGTRYFQTDHQRGVFVKVDDFKIISLPNQSTKDSRTITPTHASALEA